MYISYSLMYLNTCTTFSLVAQLPGCSEVLGKKCDQAPLELTYARTLLSRCNVLLSLYSVHEQDLLV